MTYIEGFVAPVPKANEEAFRACADQSAPLFKEFGANRHVETWGDDLPDGKVNDFKKSVQAEDNETVAFSWLEYPDKQARDAANERMMNDPQMKDMDMPFDGKRMIYGGFDAFVDEGDGSKGGYADGMILPVPEAKKDAYRELAEKSAKQFREHGAVRVVEAWGDDVPDGKVTDFRRAVKAEDGESVVYSFIEWPDKETRDRAWEKMMADPEMQPGDDMPFDGKRMFWGGFRPIFDA